MKFTLDTNFLISATQWDDSVAHKLLIKLLKTNSEIFTTKEILEEFKEVLKRDFLYNDEEIENIIEKLLHFINVVTPIIKIDIIQEDKDDNKVIECALESNSNYIISYDKHLLNLKGFKGIKIVKPEDVIGEV